MTPPASLQTGILEVRDPGDLSQGVIASYPWSLTYVDQAVAAARQAFPQWRNLGMAGREEILRRVQEGIRSHKEELAITISEEMGKPIVEARKEIDAMVAKFDITLPDAARLLAPHRHPDEPSTMVRGEPLGVTAVIGPFNFPGHLVGGMVIPALATGNTVVLKPASISPRIWMKVTKIFEEAGLPSGVLNYVVGDSRVGQALAAHPDVDLLLFTGSVAAGRAIKMAAAGTHKQVKLEMGGAGAALVLDDADIVRTAELVVTGATVRGGQNCNATRLAIAVGDQVFGELRAAIEARMGGLRIGYQFREDIDYGPLATDPASGFQNDMVAATRLGADIVYQGELPVSLPQGYYVAPVLYIRRSDTFQRQDATELFGPALGLVLVSSEEEGLALMNLLHLRLSAAIHCSHATRARGLAMGLDWGQVVINGPTVGASSKVDFAGRGEATYGGSGGRAMTAHTVTLVNVIG